MIFLLAVAGRPLDRVHRKREWGVCGESRDEPPLKNSVGGKTREPLHDCRSCQKPLLTEHTSWPPHVTVTEPCLAGLRAAAGGKLLAQFCGSTSKP